MTVRHADILRLAVAISVALGVAGARELRAAPAADVVVVWAPGADRAPLLAVGQELGVGVIDRTPEAAPQPDTGALVRRGVAAYDALDYDAAWTALESARQLADRTGAAGLAAAELSDLFLYRALVLERRGNTHGAWDDLVTAMVVDPVRRLDPVRFSPKILDEAERARAAALARPQGAVAIDVPAGCAIAIDGRPFDGAAPLLAGSHWASVACRDRQPWGGHIIVTEARTTIAPRLVALAPPGDDDVLVQARAAGARGVIVAEVHGGLATARLIGLDGRERSRRTVAVTGDLAPLARAIRALAHPAREAAPPWYRSRWALAVGVAAAAAAVAIPLTVGLTGDRSPRHAVIGGPR
ncbi:MAG: hypothetical protein KF773_36585 [Deltaproteobacteria bacterium]|nr:hypothetical protein [Deltaproteobacteria bacterium]